MAQSQILREFLVLLGYKVDSSSEAKFTRALEAATLKAKLLGDGIEEAARAVHDAVAAMARDLEQLYFASKRTGAAVENIKAMQLALTQLGGSADGALGTLESIARFMRNNPAGEGFIRGLGVQTRGANGALRDTSEIVTDLGKRLAAMPSYMANAYAGVLGVDERTLLALRQGLGDYAETYHRFVAAAHLDQQKAATDSHAFMVASRNAASATGVLLDKVAGQLTGPLAKQLEQFTTFLVAHYDQISRGLEAAGKAVLWIVGIFTTAALRIGDAVGTLMSWFDGLDTKTQHLIEAAGGLLIALRLLSRGFMTTPLGIVIAGLTALLLLLEDYTGWKSGKRSLIDWSLFDGGIQQAVRGFQEIGGWVNTVMQATVGWQHALEAIAVLMAGSWLTRVVGAFKAAAAAQVAATATGASGGGMGGLAGTLLRLAPLALTGAANGEDPEFSKRKNDEWLRNHPRAATGGGNVTGSRQQREAGMVGWLRANLGLTPEQAAGITGHAVQESGVGTSMQERNPIAGRGGLGLFQWTGARRVAYEKWAAEQGLDPRSMQASLGFFKQEVTSPAYARILASVRQQSTEVGAARAFFPFESGGDPRAIYGNRDRFATEALGAYGRSGGDQAGGTTTNAPVAQMTTTIHVDGAHDPQATARAVGAQQERVAQAASRNLRGAVS